MDEGHEDESFFDPPSPTAPLGARGARALVDEARPLGERATDCRNPSPFPHLLLV
jgi:hypothetical protein